ncbi:MAG TPA: SHOCT domain-containing protein [Gaiellaceae bacterium]|nr:SHOCT domain-containing protein [Gaiellaceae bacterium]
MNPYPPFPGRGFGFGPGLRAQEHVGNTPLQWATFALVLLIVLTLGALIVARLSGGGPRRRSIARMRRRGRPDALEVVRMRFASGQISREEYLQAVSDLTPDAPTQPQPPAET